MFCCGVESFLIHETLTYKPSCSASDRISQLFILRVLLVGGLLSCWFVNWVFLFCCFLHDLLVCMTLFTPSHRMWSCCPYSLHESDRADVGISWLHWPVLYEEPKSHNWVKVKIPHWKMTLLKVKVAYQNITWLKVFKWLVFTVLNYQKYGEYKCT